MEFAKLSMLLIPEMTTKAGHLKNKQHTQTSKLAEPMLVILDYALKFALGIRYTEKVVLLS